MGYYIRVLSKSDVCPPFQLLHRALGGKDLLLVEGTDADWRELTIQYEGTDVALVDRRSAAPGTTGAEEVAEFLEQLDEARPKAAAEWLRAYLRDVKSIYAFQILAAAYEGRRWDHISEIQGALWNAAGGILQADQEGFSNEDGYHILWQFNDDVKGDRWAAVLENGMWRSFQMDLGNPQHREAFKAGKVPPGIAVV